MTSNLEGGPSIQWGTGRSLEADPATCTGAERCRRQDRRPGL